MEQRGPRLFRRGRDVGAVTNDLKGLSGSVRDMGQGIADATMAVKRIGGMVEDLGGGYRRFGLGPAGRSQDRLRGIREEPVW